MKKKDKSEVKIRKKEAIQALLRSGYLIENRLETVLDDEGFYVEANTAYPDPITGKSRELDLYAMKFLTDPENDKDNISVILLIECVNNPQPVAFITKKPQVGFLFHNDHKIAGLPVKIIYEQDSDEEESWISLQDFLGMQKYHHYCKKRVSTQFCSFLKKKGSTDWLAHHDIEHFEPFRKLCDIVAYYIDEQFKNWVYVEDYERSIDLEIYYPILVLQGNLYDARPTKKSVNLIEAPHIQFRRRAITKGIIETYQIDVVEEAYFPIFLELIKKETQRTLGEIRRHENEVRNSIAKIVKEAKGLKSPSEIQKALEF